MLDHASDGFDATLHAAPYTLGGLIALALILAGIAALVLILDTLTGTVQAALRTRREHRAWRRSGRTPSR